mgnify:CR=1 FL=1
MDPFCNVGLDYYQYFHVHVNEPSWPRFGVQTLAIKAANYERSLNSERY